MKRFSISFETIENAHNWRVSFRYRLITCIRLENDVSIWNESRARETERERVGSTKWWRKRRKWVTNLHKMHCIVTCTKFFDFAKLCAQTVVYPQQHIMPRQIIWCNICWIYVHRHRWPFFILISSSRFVLNAGVFLQALNTCLSLLVIFALLNEFNTWKKNWRRMESIKPRVWQIQSAAAKKFRLEFVHSAGQKRFLVSSNVFWPVLYTVRTETLSTFDCIFFDAIRAIATKNKKEKHGFHYAIPSFQANNYTKVLPPNPKCQFGCLA